MAKKRDIIIGVIIVGSFLVAFAFFSLMVAGLFSAGDGLDIAGFGGNVGVIEMFGIITDATSAPIIKQIDRWASSNSIKAIVIHINSPGGAVAPSQEIYDAILRARDKKHVVASIASVGASGGYYVACAADKIVANPGTLTGSIGVILQFHTFEVLMKKVGIATETVKSGELKDIGSYSREMTEEEELMLRGVVMDTYEQFVEAVAEGRSKPKEEIYPLADGSIFTGLQAYNLGLVDTLGGLYEAVNLAASLAGIEGEPTVVRPIERKQISIWDVLGGIARKLDNSVEEQLTGPKLMFLYK
jgi:protease-4